MLIDDIGTWYTCSRHALKMLIYEHYASGNHFTNDCSWKDMLRIVEYTLNHVSWLTDSGNKIA